MKKRYLLIVLLISTGLSLSACDQNSQSKNMFDTKKSTPEKRTLPAGVMVKVDPTLAAEGEKVYQQNCIFCHQADAIGKPGFAPSLTNKEFLSVASNKFLMSTIRDGRPGTGMPPFAHLGRKQVEAIVAYLRDHAVLPDISAAIDAQPEAHGDPRLGEMWFRQICSTCHGFNGDGYSAGSTGTAIGKAGFLDKVTDGFIRFTIVNGRSNTRMLSFNGPAALANLTDREIDDIISYLRTTPSKN
ncbi:Cytochrome c oxidase subunit CcoP [hydrothermal vent metagenome]|uniref:Cytochrome c oxidase subunit CcoP n=1 Tax=hydrothermal vent metagenome TaxID=652676 RepID=A0A3B1A1A3_9ZZZZ